MIGRHYIYTWNGIDVRQLSEQGKREALEWYKNHSQEIYLRIDCPEELIALLQPFTPEKAAKEIVQLIKANRVETVEDIEKRVLLYILNKFNIK